MLSKRMSIAARSTMQIVLAMSSSRVARGLLGGQYPGLGSPGGEEIVLSDAAGSHGPSGVFAIWSVGAIRPRASALAAVHLSLSTIFPVADCLTQMCVLFLICRPVVSGRFTDEVGPGIVWILVPNLSATWRLFQAAVSVLS